MADKNLHEGHRERLKNQFLESGLDGFNDHQILELLLFYSIPQKDTNDIAHMLINEFGSLSGVFDASYEDLMSVSGIKHHSATLIKLIPQLFRKYQLSKANKTAVTGSDDAKDYLLEKFNEFVKAKLTSYTEETFLALCLDNSNKINNCCIVSKGTATEAVVTPRDVAAVALRNNSTNLIVAHNHPDGIPFPSKQDVDFTASLENILFPLGIMLRDHVIIADDIVFSMANYYQTKDIFRANKMSEKTDKRK